MTCLTMTVTSDSDSDSDIVHRQKSLTTWRNSFVTFQDIFFKTKTKPGWRNSFILGLPLIQFVNQCTTFRENWLV